MTELTESIFLYPAALVVPNKQVIVHTILGSCVSVCLFDTVNKIGGINHYMLPFWNGNGLPSPKYGNIAIEKLYEKLIIAGANPDYIIAKVFGGGEVIQTTIPHFNIGKKNILVAHEILKLNKIKIAAESTGGKLGRKIVFNTYTGEVTQRYVNSSANT
ncbi:MAG: chemotaxis protein CheD [Bacteroidales bacterium]|nr:chemotaxis protein CheD [Bacteroidales bacterium]